MSNDDNEWYRLHIVEYSRRKNETRGIYYVRYHIFYYKV